MSFGDFENLTAAEKRLFVAKAALVVAVCLSLVFFLVSLVTPRQDDAWAENEEASVDAGSEDGAGSKGQSALADLANANSDVVTTETIDAAAREAQQAAAEAHEGKSSGSGSAENPAEKALSDGHEGATSVDNDEKNLVDPAQTADNSFIYDTSIASLADEAGIYDGRTVQVTGEVVGDCLSAGKKNFYWITVEAEAQNDSSTISCLVSESLASKIDTYGRYGVKGSRVQVRGAYHQACDEHDGLADIHVGTLEVTSLGVKHDDAFDIREFLPGMFLMLLGAGMVVAFQILRERMR